MSYEITIRRLTVNDCPGVANIHLFAFPEGALTRLGHEAVLRYYDWQLTGPHDCLAVGAFQEDKLGGFIFSGIFRGSLSGFVSKSRLFLFGRVLTRPWLVLNPIFWERIKLGVMALVPQKAKVNLNSDSAKLNNSFGLLAIAVDPKIQKSGIGKMLMEEAEKAAKEHNIFRMHLSVHPSNIQAIQFYEKLGWKKTIVDGVWGGVMTKKLPSE